MNLNSVHSTLCVSTYAHAPSAPTHPHVRVPSNPPSPGVPFAPGAPDCRPPAPCSPSPAPDGSHAQRWHGCGIRSACAPLGLHAVVPERLRLRAHREVPGHPDPAAGPQGESAAIRHPALGAYMLPPSIKQSINQSNTGSAVARTVGILQSAEAASCSKRFTVQVVRLRVVWDSLCVVGILIVCYTPHIHE